jgi:hypothetical protein
MLPTKFICFTCCTVHPNHEGMCFWHCCYLEFSVSVVPVATTVGGMTDGHEKAVFDDSVNVPNFHSRARRSAPS